ncbi:MAG: hypothetical protein WCK00_14760, partial [Deltaproteobacteria bacterium]
KGGVFLNNFVKIDIPDDSPYFVTAPDSVAVPLAAYRIMTGLGHRSPGWAGSAPRLRKTRLLTLRCL